MPWTLALLLVAAGATWAQQDVPPSTSKGTTSVSPAVMPTPDKNGVYSEGPGITSPIVLQRAPVVYPANAPADIVTDSSVLSLVINAEGVPVDIQIVQTHGTSFDAAAIDAVKKSRFEPGTLHEKPVPVHLYARITFFADKKPTFPRISGHYTPKGDMNYMPSHHFDSGLGFTYEVPTDLSILNAKRVLISAEKNLNQQALTKQEAKSIECGQGLLIAENHDETKVVAITAHRQDCLGFTLGVEFLSQIGSHGLDELNKQFVLSNFITARSSVGNHATWLMQSAILPKNPANPNRFIAMMVTPTPEGVAEILLEAKTRADLNTLMANRIRFDDGSESDVVPATAFTEK